MPRSHLGDNRGSGRGCGWLGCTARRSWIRSPHVRTYKLDLLRQSFANQGEERSKLSMVRSWPIHSSALLLDLMNQRQVFVTFAIRISSTPIATIGPSCRCSSPHCTTYSTDWADLVPGAAKRRCCPTPGQLSRPVRQEQHVGLGQLVFADPPGDRFDAHPAGSAIDPSHAITTRPCSPKEAQTRADAGSGDHSPVPASSLSTPVLSRGGAAR